MRNSAQESLKIKFVLWFSFFSIGIIGQAQATPPTVTIWDGTQFAIPKEFTELEIQWTQSPYYLLAKSPQENMAIGIVDLGAETVTSYFIKEILSHSVNIEEVNLKQLSDPESDDTGNSDAFSFELKTLIMGNKMFFILAPREKNENEVRLLLVEVAKKNLGELLGPEQELIHGYSLLHIGLTIAIFFGFLFFILKALKDYSKLTTSEN